MPFADMFTNTGPITRDEDNGPLMCPEPTNKLARRKDEMIIYGTQEEMDSQPVRDLLAENARLRAELEAIKPKPVTTTLYTQLSYNGDHIELTAEGTRQEKGDNLKLTFHDGVLHSAEVIK